MSTDPQSLERKVQASFAFVDVAGFTALTEAHGDEAAADLMERLGALIHKSIEQHPRAELLEITGDAALIMGREPGVLIDLMRTLMDDAGREANFPILRAGVHFGWVVPRQGRYFGTTLNLAARVTAMARGGQVLCTPDVVAAAHAMGIGTRSLGRHVLRNLTDPVELFELGIGLAADDSVIDPVCRMRVTPFTAAGTLKHGQQDYWFCSLRCAGAFAAKPEAYAGSTEGRTSS